tara:strand:- start:2199 stop:3548 length:1350 start_codon:yes stop_codon:yes gene_type:complete
MSKISQKLQQSQKLNPKQIIEANLMQLNLGSLEKRILEEVENNPTLDIIENDIDDDSEELNDNDFNWEDLISNPEDYSINPAISKEPFDKDYSQPNLMEDFMSQLNDLNLEDGQLDAAEYILGNIDDRGYLTIEPILISDKTGLSEDVILKLIDKIKKLDPPGISSLNLQECLLAQLECSYPKEELAINIIKNFFNEFKNHNYSKIIKKIGCTRDAFTHSLNLILVLNPNPASNYSTVNSQRIIPDLIVDRIKGKWHISSNNTFLPQLKINKNYEAMLLNKKTSSDTKKFLKQKIESANWFVGAILSRHSTIEKIMASIIRNQQSYFESDKRELSPLVLRTIAEDINMDISTISRATNDKFVQLPWGCFEFKSFFSEGIMTNSGDVVSNTVVKDCIKDFINNEDKESPLTDEMLTNMLLEKQYIVARRTVSKYREAMKIPTARLRKHKI